MKVPYAKALSSWDRHFGESLKALRHDVNFATQLGFMLPSRAPGPLQQLPKGWLLLPAHTMQTPNTKSMADTLQAETGETNEYIYISPKMMQVHFVEGGAGPHRQTSSAEHTAAGLCTTACDCYHNRVY